MIIAVSAKGMELSSEVDDRFGRAAFFVIYNTEANSIEKTFENKFKAAPSGAGVKTSESIVNEKAEVVISGHLGPKAADIVKGAGVKAYKGSGLTVLGAIEALSKSELEELPL